MTKKPLVHSNVPVLRLKKNLERTIAHGHPWIFRDALSPCNHPAGTVVDVLDQRGLFLCRGLVDDGPIAVRVFSLKPVPLDAAFFANRIRDAVHCRTVGVPALTDAYRLIHGESDRLPGIVVDRYGPYAVVILDGAATTAIRDTLIPLLKDALEDIGVSHVLLRQGRGPSRSLLPLVGDLPPKSLIVSERGMKLCVNLLEGQKTGLFLDHREARFLIREVCSRMDAPRVLNLFGYTGGFSVAAGLGGASEVVTVDLSKPALELAEKSWRANDLDHRCHRVWGGEVEKFLESLNGDTFDIVIADPPSFAPNEKAVPQALKAYRAMHAASLKTVRPGGFYLTASCSSHVHRDAFETTLREAAHSQKRALQVLCRLSGGMDHPVPLGFTEGEYLTTVLVRVFDK